MLDQVAAGFRSLGVYDIVEPAHMELAGPSIEQAIATCVQRGAERIIVHPYFLSPGRHSTSDIPRLVAEAAGRYPRVVCRVTEPLGLHPVMNEIILERVREAEEGL